MVKSLKAVAAGAIIAATMALPSTGALATTVIATLEGSDAGGTVTRHIASGFGSSSSGINLAAERFDLLATGGTDVQDLAGPGAVDEFFAFCVEPREYIYQGQSVTYAMSPLASAAMSSIGGIGTVKADQIAELFGRFQSNLAAPMSNVQASALQIAVWEITREFSTNALSVYNGNVFYDVGSDNPGGALSLAQTYLSAINGSGPRAQGLRALTSEGGQDLLVQVVSAAPEPGTWLMMIGGFGMIGGIARRKRNMGSSGLGRAFAPAK